MGCGHGREMERRMAGRRKGWTGRMDGWLMDGSWMGWEGKGWAGSLAGWPAVLTDMTSISSYGYTAGVCVWVSGIGARPIYCLRAPAGRACVPALRAHGYEWPANFVASIHMSGPSRTPYPGSVPAVPGRLLARPPWRLYRSGFRAWHCCPGRWVGRVFGEGGRGVPAEPLREGRRRKTNKKTPGALEAKGGVEEEMRPGVPNLACRRLVQAGIPNVHVRGMYC